MTSSAVNSGDAPVSDLDILVLFGGDEALATFFVELFAGLGLRSATAVTLPSLGKDQNDKVSHYIKSARLAVVIATFDPNTPQSLNARPNVYDEIARCQTVKGDACILLRETNGQQAVTLPSNVDGSLVVIPFLRTALHHALIPVVRELKSRSLVGPAGAPAVTFDAGSQVNLFLDKMDALWDEQLDQAWDLIHRSDSIAEGKFALDLDRFFQQYQHVFSALIRDKLRGPELRSVADRAVEESWKIAADAWAVVSESKIKRAQEELNHLTGKMRNRFRSRVDQADDKCRRGQRDLHAKPETAIRAFRAAVSDVEGIMSQLRDSHGH